MFHVRRRPADSQPRRRKKKPLGVSNGGHNVSTDREGPVLVEITHSGEGGRSVKLTAEPIEVSVSMCVCVCVWVWIGSKASQVGLSIACRLNGFQWFDALIFHDSWFFWLFEQVGSANTNQLQLFGPSIQPRHCLISLLEGVCTVTPLHADALTFVNGHHITQPTILHVSLISISISAIHAMFASSTTHVRSTGNYNSTDTNEMRERGFDLCHRLHC